MNYSKSIKKNSVINRIILSWVIVALFSSFFGIIIGAVGLGNKSKQDEVLVYGRTADGKIFKGETTMSWDNTNLKFIPLDVPMDQELQEFVYYLSVGYNIDFTFTMALIQKESDFQTEVISRTHDYGLMQINKVNHSYLKETLDIESFTDPYDNVRAGMFILRKLFEKYDDPGKVLMAYNMGENGARVLWEQGIFETNYSKSILNIQREMNAELERSLNND